MESPDIDHFHNHEGCYHWVMNAKTLSQQGSCFCFQVKGTDEINGWSPNKKISEAEADFGGKDSEIQNALPIMDKNQRSENMKVVTQSISSTQTEVKDITEEGAEVILSSDDKLVVKDFEVEKVIAEQETHDLFCPNCQSCITKRVILRKRKRIVAIKPVKVPRVEPDEGAAPPIKDQPHLQDQTGDQNKDTELFRCLSCFSFFVATASGCLRVFGIKDAGENVQSSQQVSDRNSSWFFSIIKSKRTGRQPGNDTPQNANEVTHPTLHPSKSSDGPGPLLHGGELNGSTNMNGAGNEVTPLALPPTKVPGLSLDGVKLNGSAKMNGAVSDGINSVEDGIRPVPPEGDNRIPDQTAPGVITNPDTRVELGDPGVKKVAPREWDILKSIVYGGLIESIASLGVVSSAAGSDAVTLNIVALGLANLMGGLFVILHNLQELKNNQDGLVDQKEDDDQRGALVGKETKLDQYQETLGRRENFRRHAIVAVLSYIIFGLIPPIVYGFSFRMSDDKDYKLIAVAAASFVCIAVLATAKTYVQRAPKSYTKAILYYLGQGLTASALSYVVGKLVDRILKSLGWFDTSSATPVSSSNTFLQPESIKSEWASF